MKKINWKARIQHPAFWIGIASVIATPILAYHGAKPEDVTTWQSVGDMLVNTVKNPYLLCCVGTAVLSFLGVNTDPTTAGFSDSKQALEYDAPKVDEKEGE
jgi:phi LC3 family holin